MVAAVAMALWLFSGPFAAVLVVPPVFIGLACFGVAYAVGGSTRTPTLVALGTTFILFAPNAFRLVSRFGTPTGAEAVAILVLSEVALLSWIGARCGSSLSRQVRDRAHRS